MIQLESVSMSVYPSNHPYVFGWVHIGIGIWGYVKQIKKAMKTFLAKIELFYRQIFYFFVVIN